MKRAPTQKEEAQMAKETWVDFKFIKERVGMEEILEFYGLLKGLKRKGDELVGFCPLHQGKKNPNAFHANVQKNAWHCFGDCRRGGNVLDFVALKEGGLTIRQAALLIQDWFGLAKEEQLAKKPLAKGKKPARVVKGEGVSLDRPKKGPLEPQNGPQSLPENPPLTFTLKNLDPGHSWLAERGLSPLTIKTFGLGYCSKGLMAGRIVIPIHNQKGQLIAYAGRWPGQPPEGEGKYKLPPKFKKSLVVFNLHRAQDLARKKGLILVEGFFDCFRLWQAGFHQVVALMGSSLSPEQERQIVEAVGPQGQVVLMFDGDPAGRGCTQEVLERLSSQVFVKVIWLEETQQPDSLAEDQLQEVLGNLS